MVMVALMYMNRIGLVNFTKTERSSLKRSLEFSLKATTSAGHRLKIRKRESSFPAATQTAASQLDPDH